MTRAGAPAIATVGLHKRYAGGGGLHGVDLDVPEGSVYGLVGPNGAGKTTLLSLLAGLRAADAGEIHFSTPQGGVAMCPDAPEFESWLTAREVVELAAHLGGGSPDGDRVDELLITTGLGDVGHERVGGFSRGMTQRLALAATLVNDPAIIILDEPSSALDPIGRHEVLDLIAGFGRDRTVLFSSHILADVQRVCDHVGVLIDGRLAYQGPIARLLGEHVQPVWNVSLRGDVGLVSSALAREPWVRQVSPGEGVGRLRVQVTSFEAGEQHLVAALAAIGAPVIAFEPAADDLEDVFLRLTATGRPPEMPGP